MRKHGFSRPFDPLQIFTWVIFLVLFCSFFFVYLPFSPEKSLTYLAGPYAFLSFCVIFYTVRVCLCNPADSNLLSNIKTDHKSSKQCAVCQSSVHYTSKHCSNCDKCIENFDHHCRVLNNCIGSRNYAFFVKLLISVLSFLIFQISIGIYLLKILDNHALSIFIIIELIIEIIIITLLVLLLGFHYWLCIHKMTTYEYILYRKSSTHKITPSLEYKGNLYVLNSPQNRDVTPGSISQEHLTNM